MKEPKITGWKGLSRAQRGRWGRVHYLLRLGRIDERELRRDESVFIYDNAQRLELTRRAELER